MASALVLSADIKRLMEHAEIQRLAASRHRNVRQSNINRTLGGASSTARRGLPVVWQCRVGREKTAVIKPTDDRHEIIVKQMPP
jgi:hypothetical protein